MMVNGWLTYAGEWMLNDCLLAISFDPSPNGHCANCFRGGCLDQLLGFAPRRSSGALHAPVAAHHLSMAEGSIGSNGFTGW